MKLINLVAGHRGEVGSAIYNILKEKFNTAGFDKGEVVGISNPDRLKDPYDVKYLHVCIGWSDIFIDIVVQMVKDYRPEVIVVHSTVPIGTCDKIDLRVTKETKEPVSVIHTPIRGMHPDMEPGIKQFVKYIGCSDLTVGIELGAMFQLVGIETQQMASTTETEIAKLTSTLRRAMAIGVVQYIQRLCDIYSADFTRVYGWWEQTYNTGYKELGMPEAVRPILFPGVIGKHCLIPNAKILQEQHPSKFIEALLESNERRTDELEGTKKDV